jgi:CubicO group peptidase (beta-lactamase class C family)
LGYQFVKLLRLFSLGSLTLDSTLGELLDASQKYADPRIAAITLRQLATHTSGLPRLPDNMEKGASPSDPYARYGWDELSAYLAAAKLKGVPPFAPVYSNLGFGLLGEVLARVYRQPWEELVAEKITRPLKLVDTAATLDSEQLARFVPAYDGRDATRPWTFRAIVGAGALRSTAADLVRFGQALLAPEKTPLRAAIVLMMTPQTDDRSIGLGMDIGGIDGATAYEHGGVTGGYRSFFRVVPKTATIQVVLTNNTTLEPIRIVVAARSEKPRQNESSRTLTAKQLDEYAGIYLTTDRRFTIVRNGELLMAQLAGQPFLPIFPHETADRFFYKAVPAEIQFQRDNGTVTGLTLFQNGKTIPAKRDTEKAPSVIFRDSKALAEFAGIYELKPGVRFTVKVEADTLFVQLTGQRFLPVIERRKDRFEYDAVNAALKFERDESGKILALILYQNGLEQRAARKSPQ